MNLYIQIKDGQPHEHPIFEDNLLHAIPGIDLNNLPPEFSPFVRVPEPILKTYTLFDENYKNPSYELVDGVYTDVWHIRDMTPEEKQASIDFAKLCFFGPGGKGYKSWIFNEENCRYEPPIPYPNDGKHYEWSENFLTWYEVV
jgi:hypothetical protein